MAEYLNTFIAAELLEFGSGAGADVTHPEVVNISPSPGGIILPDTYVVFDVVDETRVSDVVVYVDISGRWEVIFGGSYKGFAPGYGLSSVVAIAGGFRFSLRRGGGWSSRPTFSVLGFDYGGNTT